MVLSLEEKKEVLKAAGLPHSGQRFEIYWTTKYKALEYIQRAGLEITSKGRGRVKV